MIILIIVDLSAHWKSLDFPAAVGPAAPVGPEAPAPCIAPTSLAERGQTSLVTLLQTSPLILLSSQSIPVVLKLLFFKNTFKNMLKAMRHSFLKKKNCLCSWICNILSNFRVPSHPEGKFDPLLYFLSLGDANNSLSFKGHRMLMVFKCAP